MNEINELSSATRRYIKRNGVNPIRALLEISAKCADAEMSIEENEALIEMLDRDCTPEQIYEFIFKEYERESV